MIGRIRPLREGNRSLRICQRRPAAMPGLEFSAQLGQRCGFSADPFIYAENQRQVGFHVVLGMTGLLLAQRRKQALDGDIWWITFHSQGTLANRQNPASREKVRKLWLRTASYCLRAFSLLFISSEQRHHPVMLLDFLIQLLTELVRALFIDALSERVRRRITETLGARRSRRRAAFYHRLSNQHQKRLLHKLLTDKDERASEH